MHIALMIATYIGLSWLCECDNEIIHVLRKSFSLGKLQTSVCEQFKILSSFSKTFRWTKVLEVWSSYKLLTFMQHHNKDSYFIYLILIIWFFYNWVNISIPKIKHKKNCETKIFPLDVGRPLVNETWVAVWIFGNSSWLVVTSFAWAWSEIRFDRPRFSLQ